MATIAAIQDTGAQTSLQSFNHFHLVAAQVLLERVWPDHRARPCLRWLWEQQRVRAIPSTRVGRRVLFCPAHVLAFAGNKLTLVSRRSARSSCGVALPTPDSLIDAGGLLELLLREFGLKRSLRWVRQQQENRTLPFIKWGHKVFFAPSQIKAALQA